MDNLEIVLISFGTYWSLVKLLHHRIKRMYTLKQMNGIAQEANGKSIDTQAYLLSTHILTYDV